MMPQTVDFDKLHATFAARKATSLPFVTMHKARRQSKPGMRPTHTVTDQGTAAPSRISYASVPFSQ